MYAACLTVLPVAPAVTAAAAAARPENQNLIRQKNKEKRLFCKCWGLANQQVFLAPNTIVFGVVLFAQQ